VAEAARCHSPGIGLIATNSDPTALSHPSPGNADAVKSIRIIVETIVEAVQTGFAQRESRRTARGQADLRAATAAVAEAAGATNEAGEVDLSKVELPADINPETIEGEDAAKLAAKKKPARKKIAAPKDAVEAEVEAK
jgi:small subunit ribosomal protein S2